VNFMGPKTDPCGTLQSTDCGSDCCALTQTLSVLSRRYDLHKSTVGSRASSVADPQVWNCLPPEVTSAPYLASFRTRYWVISWHSADLTFCVYTLSMVELAVFKILRPLQKVIDWFIVDCWCNQRRTAAPNLVQNAVCTMNSSCPVYFSSPAGSSHHRFRQCYRNVSFGCPLD